VGHWTEQLFLEYGEIFLKMLKTGEESAPKEVEILMGIFAETDIHQGDSLLDLCCGYGRHALLLAGKGFKVMGVDLSPAMIEEAKKLAKTRGIEDRVKFLVGDTREISKLLKPKLGSSNAIINMQTSLGYYEDETDVNILKQLNGLASSGGVLVIDTANRDYLIRHFQPFGISELKYLPEYERHEHRKLNLESSRMENTWKFYKKEGEELKHVATIPLNHRVYSLHELINLLETTGWKYAKSYGNFELQPVTTDTHRIIIVGKKD
jgi:SAM-dependent methyltransferase